MAVKASRVNVGATATALSATDDSRAGEAVVVRNRGSAAVYLGGSDVTSSTGFQLDAGDTLAVDVTYGETLYAVAADAGPYRLDLLWQGVQ